jgi:hypothetical protein
LEFIPLAARPFQTLRVDLREVEQPLAGLLEAIRATLQPEAVTRLIYQLHASQVPQIDQVAVKQALALAHVATLQPQVIEPLTTARAPNLQPNRQITPLEALELYCEARPHLAPLRVDLLEAASLLLAEDDRQPLVLNGRVGEVGTPYDDEVEQLPLL